MIVNIEFNQCRAIARHFNINKMKIRVLSKNLFDDILPRMGLTEENAIRDDSKAFISILNSDTPNNSYFKNEAKNVLKLVFDDITDREIEMLTKRGDRMIEDLILFNREHANRIIAFMENNKDVETLYVHCTAGVSRSGAVGTFINDVYGKQTFLEFCNSNPYIHPNFYILALLRRVYNNIEDEE